MVVESATASSLRLGVVGLAGPGEIGTKIVVEFPGGGDPGDTATRSGFPKCPGACSGNLYPSGDSI